MHWTVLVYRFQNRYAKFHVHNRTGHESDWSGVTGGIEFWGQSFVAGPQGEVLHLSSVG